MSGCILSRILLRHLLLHVITDCAVFVRKSTESRFPLRQLRNPFVIFYELPYEACQRLLIQHCVIWIDIYNIHGYLKPGLLCVLVLQCQMPIIYNCLTSIWWE